MTNNLQTPLLPQAIDTESRKVLLKELFTQAWPLMLRGGVVSARYFAIAVLLGRKDEHLLSANALITSFESICIIFGGRSLGVVSSEIGKCYGAISKAEKDKLAEGATPDAIAACDAIINTNREKISVIFRHGLILAGLISLPLTGMYYFGNHRLLQLFGQHPFAVEKARDYFQAAAWGYGALTLLTALQRISQGFQKPIAPLLTNTLHSGLSVLFSYLFLFGKLGLPKLDIDGVGYAFVIASWTTLFVNALYLLFKKDLQPYQLFSTQGGFQRHVLKELATTGIPSGAQFASENIANMINSLFLGLHNLTALSADQIAMQMALCSSIANGGLSQAVNTCVSKAVGQERYTSVKQYGNMGLLLGMSFPTIACIVFLFAREQFISLFVNTHNPDNDELVRLASGFLLLECLRQFVTGIKFTASGGLLSFKESNFTMKTSLVFSLAVNAAILCLLHFVLHLNSITLFAAKVIGDGLAALLNATYWVVRSHEQSRAEKLAIEDKSLPQRITRAGKLLLMGAPAVELADDVRNIQNSHA